MERDDTTRPADSDSRSPAARVWDIPALRLSILEGCEKKTLARATVLSTASYVDVIGELWGREDWRADELDGCLAECHSDPDRYLACANAVRQCNVIMPLVRRLRPGQRLPRKNPTWEWHCEDHEFLARALQRHTNVRVVTVMNRWGTIATLYLRQSCILYAYGGYGHQERQSADPTHRPKWLPRTLADTLRTGHQVLLKKHDFSFAGDEIVAKWEEGKWPFADADVVSMYGTLPHHYHARILDVIARGTTGAGGPNDAVNPLPIVPDLRVSPSFTGAGGVVEAVSRLAGRVRRLEVYAKPEDDGDGAPSVYDLLGALNIGLISTYDAVSFECHTSNPPAAIPEWVDAPTLGQWTRDLIKVTLVLRHPRTQEVDGETAFDKDFQENDALSGAAATFSEHQAATLDLIADHALAALGPVIPLTVRLLDWVECGCKDHDKVAENECPIEVAATKHVRARIGRRVMTGRQGQAPGWRRLERGAE